MKKLIAMVACTAALVLPGFASEAHGIPGLGEAQAGVQLKSPMVMAQSAVNANGVPMNRVASTGALGRGAMVLAGVMLMFTIAGRRRKF